MYPSWPPTRQWPCEQRSCPTIRPAAQVQVILPHKKYNLPTPPPPAAFRAFAAEIKIAIGIVQARSCSLKVLLKSGCLDGKDVQVRNKNNEVLLRGTVVEHGLIACACKLCKGKAWSCSSFEAHSGSTAHRPAEFIFLAEFGRSLKDLIALVSAEDLDVHDEACGTCKKAGDLLCCGSCPRAYHAECVGLSAAPPVRGFSLICVWYHMFFKQSEWFCKDCVLAQVAAAEAAAAAAAARYKPNKLKRGPLSSVARVPGRLPKRLRMSAPQIRGQHRRNKGNGSRNKLLFTRSNGALQVCRGYRRSTPQQQPHAGWHAGAVRDARQHAHGGHGGDRAHLGRRQRHPVRLLPGGDQLLVV